MNIAKAIKLCRVSRGYTQIFLAEKAGLSPSYLSLVEKGRREPTITAIKKIAEALDLPSDLLLLLAIEAGDSQIGNVTNVKNTADSLLKMLLVPRNEQPA